MRSHLLKSNLKSCGFLLKPAIELMLFEFFGLFPIQMINPSGDQAYQCLLPGEGHKLAFSDVYLPGNICAQHWVIYCLLTSSHILTRNVCLLGTLGFLLFVFFLVNNVIILNLCLSNSL